MLQMSKSQKKKANKQQKAAMQLAESPPEALSPMDGANPAPASTSGAELQVCSLTNFARSYLALLLVAAQHVAQC